MTNHEPTGACARRGHLSPLATVKQPDTEQADMSKFRVFHYQDNDNLTHIAVEDGKGYGAIARLYPNSPHYTMGCYAHVMAQMLQWGTPDPGSGLNHPEMSYDLWIELARQHESIMGRESGRTPVELYALWLIGQPPESITEE